MPRRFRELDAGDDAAQSFVPLGVRVAAAWAWRLIIIAAAVSLFAVAVAYLRVLVIPLLVALLVTALLKPLVDWLQRRRWPRSLAVLAALVLFLGAMVGAVWIIATQIGHSAEEMGHKLNLFWEGARTWLYDSPLHLTDSQISQYIDSARSALESDSSTLLNGAISVGSTAGHVVAGVLLTVFSLIFLLYDSHNIFAWTVRLFPRASRPAVSGAVRVGWHTVSSWARVQVLVALVDAVGITVVAAILGLPMLLPIGLFVFVASFVPIVGAIVSGFFVCVVALVFSGFWPAIIMLGGVIAVHELEAHVMQPFMMGSAVKVHPLAVVLSVAAGALLAGIAGTLFAVPVVAAANVMVTYINSGQWRGDPSSGQPSPSTAPGDLGTHDGAARQEPVVRQSLAREETEEKSE